MCALNSRAKHSTYEAPKWLVLWRIVDSTHESESLVVQAIKIFQEVENLIKLSLSGWYKILLLITCKEYLAKLA